MCELEKEKFDDPEYIMEGGDLRTYQRIKSLAAQYQEFAAKSTSDKKPSSAPFKNCEHTPLCLPVKSEDDDIAVIDALAIMVRIT